MTDDHDLSALAIKLETAAFDKAVTDADYFDLQKLVFKNAITAIKAKGSEPLPEADYLVGMIGMTDGDRFGIPPQNVLAHLNKAYQNGHAGAGILLYRAYTGVSTYIPATMRSDSKGILLLEALAKKGFPHALYELSVHYRNLIDGYEQAGDEAPEEHFHEMYRYANDAMKMKYSGGYLLMGMLSYFGLTGLVPSHYPTAYKYFIDGLSIADESFFQYDITSQLHNWIGYCLFTGEGIGRDRISGLKHIQISANMANSNAQAWLDENKAAVEDIQRQIENPDVVPYDLDIDVDASLFEPAPSTEAEVLQRVHDQGNPLSSFADAPAPSDRPILKKPTTH